MRYLRFLDTTRHHKRLDVKYVKSAGLEVTNVLLPPWRRPQHPKDLWLHCLCLHAFPVRTAVVLMTVLSVPVTARPSAPKSLDSPCLLLRRNLPSPGMPMQSGLCSTFSRHNHSMYRSCRRVRSQPANCRRFGEDLKR